MNGDAGTTIFNGRIEVTRNISCHWKISQARCVEFQWELKK